MTTKLDQLHAQKRELVEETNLLQAEYDEYLAYYQPQIDEMAHEADKLAEEFKRLIHEAADAYASDDGALAKELSNERKAKQARCEELNASVNELRQTLASMHTALRTAQAHLNWVLKEIDQITKNSPTRHLKLTGFRQAHGVTPGIVQEELGVLPGGILEKIEAVNYIHEVARDGAVGRTANKGQNPDKTKIYLYVNFSSFDEAKLEKDYRDTIVHEAGHVLFDWVMSSVQRWEWGKLYNQTLRDGSDFITEYAAQSMREDFGECFMKYIRDPAKLRKHDMVRYTFIDKVYKEINS